MSKRITDVGASILNREKFDSLVEDISGSNNADAPFEWFVDENDPTEWFCWRHLNEHAQLQHMNNFATFRDRFGC